MTSPCLQFTSFQSMTISERTCPACSLTRKRHGFPFVVFQFTAEFTTPMRASKNQLPYSAVPKSSPFLLLFWFVCFGWLSKQQHFLCMMNSPSLISGRHALFSGFADITPHATPLPSPHSDGTRMPPSGSSLEDVLQAEPGWAWVLDSHLRIEKFSWQGGEDMPGGYGLFCSALGITGGSQHRSLTTYSPPRTPLHLYHAQPSSLSLSAFPAWFWSRIAALAFPETAAVFRACATINSPTMLTICTNVSFADIQQCVVDQTFSCGRPNASDTLFSSCERKLGGRAGGDDFSQTLGCLSGSLPNPLGHTREHRPPGGLFSVTNCRHALSFFSAILQLLLENLASGKLRLQYLST